MTVRLAPVTQENFDAVADLELPQDQRAFVASNSYSIAQASFYPHYHTRAIYADDVLVGFLMYVSLAEEGYPGEYAIWRMMVERRHQGRGYGRAALHVLLEQIRNDADARQVWISYVPDNAVAKRLYAGFGFVETEIDEDGEMVAVLDLPEIL